jgi:hypothetical protein
VLFNPFIFLSDAKPALRASYAVAIVMLFAAVRCSDIIAGFGRGRRDFRMVAVGSTLVDVAVALGG